MCFIHKEAILFNILTQPSKILNASQVDICTPGFPHREALFLLIKEVYFCGETFCIMLKNCRVPWKLFQFSEMIIFNHSPSKTIY